MLTSQGCLSKNQYSCLTRRISTEQKNLRPTEEIRSGYLLDTGRGFDGAVVLCAVVLCALPLCMLSLCACTGMMPSNAIAIETLTLTTIVTTHLDSARAVQYLF